MIMSLEGMAECSKNEVFKLMDKGFSKSEIKGFCNKRTVKSKWITPTNKICIDNGGEIDNGVCLAPWEEAKNICRRSGGRLATLRELKKVVSDCTGINIQKEKRFEELNVQEQKNLRELWDKNKTNNYYQNCYKSKGFTSNYYWSGTVYERWTNNGWGINFSNGNRYDGNMSYRGVVYCVREK